MKLTLLVVGKTTDARIVSLIADYEARLSHYIPFEITVIPELKNAKSLSEAQQKQAEGEMILKAAGNNYMILLDEHGLEFRSIGLAQYLQRLMAGESGGRNIVFVVGGPYGFSEAVYTRANAKMSLSKMTFSHQMIRLLFIEQIYRSMTILRGEPYHHE